MYNHLLCLACSETDEDWDHLLSCPNLNQAWHDIYVQTFREASNILVNDETLNISEKQCHQVLLTILGSNADDLVFKAFRALALEVKVTISLVKQLAEGFWVSLNTACSITTNLLIHFITAFKLLL